ncbi:hypothetical protein P9E76_01590 [Schinkia azotoformans]|uniref:Uncharacterized protein n=1 Tax=Schinkia azotoformans LMG 9581 TaxID=1131731 RepID=K6DGS1_SCHAZ|nr:hypothetical protein [Schinkia azotoformans]EKN67474.1 hypothetical protein BAZO_08291 [Schinkia azotoformans LMG 9581]MEC1637367.1 hypothetical protein [Schinkia azotoformans]MEC1943771.1 hypothetical protein [Schinkia azotoformans]
MRQTLVVNFGEYEFTNFERAVKSLEEEYGYEGFAWDMVVASNDFEILCEFLSDDGIDAEIVIC